MIALSPMEIGPICQYIVDKINPIVFKEQVYYVLYRVNMFNKYFRKFHQNS